jgi:hypothetical protein
LSAACVVSLVIGSNVFTILVVLGLIFSIDPTLGANKAQLAMAYLLILGAVYSRYALRSDTVELIAKLKRQDRLKTRKDERRLACYVFGSLALPFIIMLAGLYFRKRGYGV